MVFALLPAFHGCFLLSFVDDDAGSYETSSNVHLPYHVQCKVSQTALHAHRTMSSPFPAAAVPLPTLCSVIWSILFSVIFIQVALLMQHLPTKIYLRNDDFPHWFIASFRVNCLLLSFVLALSASMCPTFHQLMFLMHPVLHPCPSF